MLKIKDDVDLKILKEYGFIGDKHNCYLKRLNDVDNDNDGARLVIDISNNREIVLVLKINGFSLKVYEIDTIFDLIKDGLVEKC